MESLNNQVFSVRQLLALAQISIPNYQRPYRWGIRNINDLFTDLATHQNKSAYRLGSVVFHEHAENGKKLDIVDGQQRTLTLMLAVKALIDNLEEESRSGKEQVGRFQRQDLRQQLRELSAPIHAFMARERFPSRDSAANLKRNYIELRRLVARPEFDAQQIDFLLNRCQVVCFVLKDISEAFQFFDSQNARGRDLAPHDLLKAFHLREFAESEADLKAETVAYWENLSSRTLANLFGLYLYRVRQWAQGKSARYFGKSDVNLFKGVNLDRVENFPYVKSLRITHHFINDYNSQYQRKIDDLCMIFPFNLDQIIINGRRFFEMCEYYQKLVTDIISKNTSPHKQSVVLRDAALTPQAQKILDTLSKYEQRHRTGDRYVRATFDCALLFYIDKFAYNGLSIAIEQCFIWAYYCRINQRSVQLATMDNYVLRYNLIRSIRDARLPTDLRTFRLPNTSGPLNNPTAPSALVELFQEMNYYV
ncbi:hypothetical protein AD940_12520 [Gluconobacter thailandicus]|uniref:DUF262 domain-containing protein n=1 Tax=Gluconobacter thailandicus TaxID=257438 RepID=UPI000777066B|nr:DUF262 domain-containing protein [Gluconobacter thailandicus]KXV32791.1 hypothetical protein AD940_12520 [Gluconobacter thailandicus]